VVTPRLTVFLVALSVTNDVTQRRPGGAVEAGDAHKRPLFAWKRQWSHTGLSLPDPLRSVKFLQTGHSVVVACNKAIVPARTNRSGKWQLLRQSQIPQHIKYVLRGTLNVPRTMCNAEPTPQRRAQRTHDNAPVG
jgi:hypothetical protein